MFFLLCLRYLDIAKILRRFAEKTLRTIAVVAAVALGVILSSFYNFLVMTHLCYVSEYSREGLFDFRSILGIHNIDCIERCKLIQRMGKYHLAIFL